MRVEALAPAGTHARRRGARRRELAAGYLLCAPAFLFVFGIVLYPFLVDLLVSLTDAHDFALAGSFVGFRNYLRLAADPVFWEAMRNTVVLVALTSTVELALGLASALLLWTRFPGRALLFVAVFVPWAFPSSFSAFAWYWMFFPPFHAFYSLPAIDLRFFLEDHFGQGAYQVLAIAVMNVWRGSSIIAIFLLAGLNAIPEELVDFARLEARTALRLARSVLAPLVRRYLVLAAVVAITVTYLDYVSMYWASGGRITVPVIGTLAFQRGIVLGDTGVAAAATMSQLPVFALLVLLALRALERDPPAPGKQPEPAWRVGRAASPALVPTGRPAPRRRHWAARRRLHFAGLMLAALALVAFHLLPLYYVAIQAVRPIGEFPLGQILWAYHPDFTPISAALHDPVLWLWARNTLVVFGLALAIGLSASLLAGYALARLRPPGATWLARLMFFSYFVPQFAVAIPLFAVYSRLGLDNSIPGIVLLYLTLVVPFSTWLFTAYFLGLDPDVEEHARLECGRVQAFLFVVLPMAVPVIIAAGLFGLGMMASDTFYGPVFSLTNDTKTLPVGLGLTAIDLEEWADVNGSILLASLPLILVCAGLGRTFVRGLRAALLEGA